MKLSDLRQNVRTQTETIDVELPDSTIDWYLGQAFVRQMAHENSWPFYEKTWELTLPVGATSLPIPADVNKPGIVTVRDVETGIRLMMIDHTQADGWFGGVDPSATFPSYFSVWGDVVYLWPQLKFAGDRPFQIRGHRHPIDWLSNGPEAEPDCDSRLHGPLIHYAIALAYAQQEDETLENVYMQRWQMDFTQAAQAIMEPIRGEPLVMAPQHITPIGARYGMPRATVNVPGGF